MTRHLPPMVRRRPSMDALALPPMVSRPLTEAEQAVAPMRAYLAGLNRQLAAIEWETANDPEERT